MQLIQSILFALWHTLLEMAPYLLFGFLVAGILSVIIPTSFVEKHLGRGKWLPSVKAALFGVPLPLCSCGVIPVAAGLKRKGASHGATTAFLLSTPQTGVDSMLVTYSLLGMTFALFAPVAALVSGVLAGLIITLVVRDGDGLGVTGDGGEGREVTGDGLRETSGSAGASCCASKKVDLSIVKGGDGGEVTGDGLRVTSGSAGVGLPTQTSNDLLKGERIQGVLQTQTLSNVLPGGRIQEGLNAQSCCSSDSAVKKGGRIQRMLRHGFITLPKDIALPLLWGLLVAGLLSALIPEDFFTGQASSGWLTKFIMLGAGIPMYVCATASIPIAASLIMAGISPGAAFIFLMSGPATNAATITTIWKIMGRKTLFIYLGVVIFSALTAGVILDEIFIVTESTAQAMGHEMLPEGMKVICAAVLIAILGYAKWGQPYLALRRQDAKKIKS